MRAYKATTMRLSDKDRELLATLRERYGQASNVGIIRLALRTLDAQAIAERRPYMDNKHLDVLLTANAVGALSGFPLEEGQRLYHVTKRDGRNTYEEYSVAEDEYTVLTVNLGDHEELTTAQKSYLGTRREILEHTIR